MIVSFTSMKMALDYVLISVLLVKYLITNCVLINVRLIISPRKTNKFVLNVPFIWLRMIFHTVLQAAKLIIWVLMGFIVIHLNNVSRIVIKFNIVLFNLEKTVFRNVITFKVVKSVFLVAMHLI